MPRSVNLLGAAFVAMGAAAYPDTLDWTPQGETELATGQLRVMWAANSADSSIEFMIQSESTGWLGFGVGSGDPASMAGADMVIGWVSDGGVGEVHDAYSASHASTPVYDDSNDATLLDSAQADGWTTLLFSRPQAATESDVDVALDNGIAGLGESVPIIVAVGFDDTFSYHVSAHGAGSAAGGGDDDDAAGGDDDGSGEVTYTQATEYAPLDQWGNNEVHPDWGATGDDYRRQSEPAFADGFFEPSGQNRPGARNISNVLFSRPSASQTLGPSDLVVFWGQYLAHDISMTGGSSESWPIPIPECDRFFDPDCTGTAEMGFSRSVWNASTGTDASNPKQQTNHQTAFIDASQVYGQTADRAERLRSYDGGKLVLGEHDELPPNDDIHNVSMAAEAQCPCAMRKAGDARANENLVLFSLHTVWAREHNRWCDVLAAQHPTWTDETLYWEARRRVVALHQKVTLYEYLPAVVGEPLEGYSGYDAALNPQLSEFFNVVAFRYGHTELSAVIPRVAADNKMADAGPVLLREALFRATDVLEPTDFDLESVFRGIARQYPQKVDLRMVEDVRSFLFGYPEGSLNGASDLAARSIQRGRDHGLPDYNTVRVDHGFDAVTSFSDITDDEETALLLAELYNNDVNNIDPYVAALAETHLQSSLVGELVTESIVDAFRRLRDADRFYFENDQFSDAELAELLDTRLADVIRRNTDLDDDLPNNAFFADTRYVFDTSEAAAEWPLTGGYTYDASKELIEGKYRLLWNGDDDHVEFMLQAATEGWVGLGFSPDQAGIMLGADIQIGRVLDTGVEVLDYKAVANVGKPEEDGAQDLSDIEGWQEDGWTVIRFSKKRSTGDANDNDILTDGQYVIYAFQADTDDFVYHGANVAFSTIAFANTGLPWIQLSDGAKAFSLALTVVALAMAAGSLVLVVGWRKTRVMRHASPKFLLIVILGVALGAASNLTRAVDPPTASSCSTTLWLSGLGFAITFSALSVKSWRIQKLFNSKKLRRIAITDKQLGVLAVGLVSAEVLLLALWTLVDAPAAVEVVDITGDKRFEGCAYSESGSMTALFYALNGLYLVGGVWLAARTYSVPSTFNESKPLAVIIYNLLLTGVIFVPAAQALSEARDLSFQFESLGVAWVCVTTLALLFGPKAHMLYTGSAPTDAAGRPGATSNTSAAAPGARTITQYRVPSTSTSAVTSVAHLPSVVGSPVTDSRPRELPPVVSSPTSGSSSMRPALGKVAVES